MPDSVEANREAIVHQCGDARIECGVAKRMRRARVAW